MQASRAARVGLSHEADDSPSDDRVLEMVREAVDALGGIRAFVRPGDNVLLKPNVTVWFTARDGVTTDPRIVAAAVTLCKEAGAAHVAVADSSGGDVNTSHALDVTGIRRLAEQAGADDVFGLEERPQEPVEVRAGSQDMRVPVGKPLIDAQVVINLPKIKTHFEDPISCALKNWVGIIDQKNRPMFMDDPLLYQVTAGLHARVRAHLTIVDGLWAGEGTGPVANDGVWLGAVLAGVDPVAVDVTAARLVGLDPMTLRFAEAAERAGVGTRDVSRITVAGPRVEDIAIRARPAQAGFDHLPVRVLKGEGVSWAGSLGHFKSLAEVFHKYDMWPAIERVYGPPTFMLGRIHDPRFEEHVEEGPYFVIDNVAHARYREDDRVTFIPGHPATHNIFPHIFDRLHVSGTGPKMLQVAGAMKRVEAYFHNRRWSVESTRTRERST